MPHTQLNQETLDSMREYVINHRNIHKDVPLDQWKSYIGETVNMVAADLAGVIPSNPSLPIYLEEFRKMIDEIVA